MPVQYAGVIQEHRAVRSAAGLFDLSHMGEIEVSGAGAGAALDAALVSEPSSLAVGRAQYSIIVDERGGMLDDLVVYRTAVESWLVVANASNRATVVAALQDRIRGTARVRDLSDETAMIAIQGPLSLEILAPLVELDDASALGDLRGYASRHGRFGPAKIAALIARTGYTGEDGFEIYTAASEAAALWRQLLAAGTHVGAQPIGLGARDTLRLEAGMPLYGNELRRELTPYDVGLGRVVRLGKGGDFVGRTALTARSMQYAWGANVGLPLIREVAQNVAGHDGVIINRATAKRLGIADGDPIVLESASGTTRGRATLREGIRPDTVLLIGQFDHWATPVAKDFGVASLNSLTDLAVSLTDATGSGADIMRVSVKKASR